MSDLNIARQRELSSAQRMLVQRLRDRKVRSEPDGAGIPRVDGVRFVPLTSDQGRICFLARLFPESAEYNQSVTMRFAACPDAGAFMHAFGSLVDRHDALRMRVCDVDGELGLELCDGLELPVSFHDLCGEPASATERNSIDIGNRLLRRPFHLEQAPLFRAALLRLPGNTGLAILVFHHLVVDGISLQTLSAELIALLSGQTLAPEAPVRFIDYAAWRAARCDEAGLSAQLAYWRERLKGDLPVLDLPSDRPRPATPSRRGHVVPCAIPAQTATALRHFAQREGTTLYVVLLSAYKAFLMRMSGATDILVGAPFSGRDHPAAENLVGMFVNTVVLRTDLGGDPSFRTLVRRVSNTVLEAQDNREAPFDKVVAQLKAPRDVWYSALFQTLFNLGGLPVQPDQGPRMNDLALDSGAAKWDLTVYLDEFDSGIEGYMEYAADLFDEATALRFADIYVRLCATFAVAPDMAIGRAPLLSDDQRRRIVRDLNPYARPADRYTTMAQPFEEQALRTPDAIALDGQEGRVSYADLNVAANRLAHELREKGVGEGCYVAVCMERCFDLIVALFAIAKSGAAYVPLDPDLPDERLAFMLADVGPALVLAHAATQARVSRHTHPVLLVDRERARWSAHPPINLPCAAAANRPVHLLYTSGSTGRPKAVVYPVSAALAEIFWLQRNYPLEGENDANIFMTSYGFDVSIWEIFWTLYFGARLVVPRHGEQRDMQRLIDLIRAERVTTMFLIPARLDLMLDLLPGGASWSLRWIFCGGAPVSARLRDRFHERFPSTLLINCYGPTEAGCVTDMVLPREPGNPRVPLGRPAPNYRLYVLDGELEPCPIGVPGEVFLGGEVGVAFGYHGRPALTAERFLPDPLGEPGGRMYRTGDLCRYHPDGVLEHLGRIDRQIKLRGMRIEPAEIEAVLCEHQAVAQCHVLVHDDPVLGQRLPAFVVCKPGQAVAPRSLLAHARRQLPPHMVPPAVIVLDALPVNVNNKIDNAALAAIDWTPLIDDPGEPVPPAGPQEEALLAVFRALLGIDDLGVESNFFNCGGHSLLIFKLMSACEVAFGHRPSIADIFTYPTVRGLLPRLGAGQHEDRTSLVPLAPQTAKPVMVFVHGIGGSVLPFGEVARSLGPVVSSWGLQAAPPDLAAEPPAIEALAAAYVAEVDAIRELSPLVLVGWSMGGCIAFDMARNWRARGVDVAAVILLDTWTPPSLLAPADRDLALAIVHGVDILGGDVTGSADAVLDEDSRARILAIRQSHAHAFAAYSPGRLDVDIDYLRARNPFPGATADFRHAMDRLPDRGWSAFARSARVHVVEGNHFSMIDRCHAAGLAQAIQAVLASRLAAEEI